MINPEEQTWEDLGYKAIKFLKEFEEGKYNCYKNKRIYAILYQCLLLEKLPSQLDSTLDKKTIEKLYNTIRKKFKTTSLTKIIHAMNKYKRKYGYSEIYSAFY